MTRFGQPPLRPVHERGQQRASVDHRSVRPDLSKRFEPKCMELAGRPADLPLSCLTCWALEARVELHPGQAPELRYHEILPRPAFACRVHRHDIECRD
jgi:hypothetical protein